MFEFFKKKKTKEAQKQNVVVLRPKNYAAAKNDRLTYSWTNYKYTSDQIIEKFLPALVARSCEQCMNNPYASRYLSLLENNVIGENGMGLQAQAKDANGKLDQVANDAHEKAWKDWQKAENCDVTGKLNFIAIQKLVLKTIAREGESLVRLCVGKDASPWGFALQLIDPRRLDVYKNESNLENGHYIRFGIEFNRYGKPLYYYINKDSDKWYIQTGGEHYKIPAEEIIHLFLPLYIDQKRGLPWYSSVLMRMNMLNGFEEAAVEHARAGACQMGFIVNNDPEAYEDDENKDTEVEIEASPATFHELPVGYDVKKFDPNYPNGEFDVFSKSILRSIAVGLNAGYSSLSGDLSSVNFSSLRQGILDEREVWKGLQEWFKSGFNSKVHTAWLKYSLLYSRIKCGNGYLKPERIDKYSDVTWSMRRWSWVDPVKDVNSAAISVQNGFRSRSDVIREQGRDPDDVWNEIEKENELLKTKGILVKNEVIKDVGEENENESETKK